MIKKRILIVDDEVAAARLLKANLEQADRYEVRVENWPEDALAAARQFMPDLVLLDVMMPHIDGGDLATRIRANRKLQRIPIVFLTAAVKRAELPPGGGMIGGLRFLAKPLELEEVRHCLSECLGDAAPAGGAVSPARNLRAPETAAAHPE